jgi:hypothetical protein
MFPSSLVANECFLVVYVANESYCLVACVSNNDCFLVVYVTDEDRLGFFLEFFLVRIMSNLLGDSAGVPVISHIRSRKALGTCNLP